MPAMWVTSSGAVAVLGGVAGDWFVRAVDVGAVVGATVVFVRAVVVVVAARGRRLAACRRGSHVDGAWPRRGVGRVAAVARRDHGDAAHGERRECQRRRGPGEHPRHRTDGEDAPGTMASLGSVNRRAHERRHRFAARFE